MNTTPAAAALPAYLVPRPAIGKCPKCAAPVAVNWSQDDAGRESYQVRSACCLRWTIVNWVDGRVGKRECGDWCTEGTGRKCTCTCGGSQHGLAWRIK